MNPPEFDTRVAVHADKRLLLSRSRIAILEAVIRYGSLTEAARRTGSCYKTVWDAVDAINNLLPSPAFVTRVGGSHGGWTGVTPLGQKVISRFRLLEERLSRLSTAILADESPELDDILLWSLAVRVSASNVFRCTVFEVEDDPVDVHVRLRVSAENSLAAIVPRDALRELRLAKGRRVAAFVNASFVSLIQQGEGCFAANRNRLRGCVIGRVDGKVNCEVRLEIGDGKVLTAIVPLADAADLNIQLGDWLDAMFNASHVILAAD
jgi:molybdate transport system regulatory protein